MTWTLAEHNRGQREFIRNPENQRDYPTLVLSAIENQYRANMPDDVQAIRDALHAQGHNHKLETP